MKMAHGLGWGPLVPPPLLGETCLVCDHVAAGEGRGEGELEEWGNRVDRDSGEVSESVGELDEGEGKGWQGGGSEGAPP